LISKSTFILSMVCFFSVLVMWFTFMQVWLDLDLCKGVSVSTKNGLTLIPVSVIYLRYQFMQAWGFDFHIVSISTCVIYLCMSDIIFSRLIWIPRKCVCVCVCVWFQFNESVRVLLFQLCVQFQASVLHFNKCDLVYNECVYCLSLHTNIYSMSIRTCFLHIICMINLKQT
jgi:hypothetical protein